MGGCTACGAPEAEAPTLLSELTDDNWETYFVRQPVTPEEVEQACRAIQCCCLDTLRYGGTDPAIITRLGNARTYCDHLLPSTREPEPARPRSFALLERRWWQFWR